MALPLKKNAVSEVYREALENLIATIEAMESSKDIYDPEIFNTIVSVALTRLGLSASELAREEGISKAAISKWLHYSANPNTPTKKVVIDWIKREISNQLAAV